MLSHQIDLELYERQAIPDKLTNFDNKLPIAQSEFARDMIKDPYIFELANISKKATERDIENAMIERIKNDTIGLLLCEDKDKLTVEWSLKNVNAPIGVASYKVKNVIPKEIMEKLPTEEELNLYIKKLPNEEIEEHD